jgi:hypothetical protein
MNIAQPQKKVIPFSTRQPDAIDLAEIVASIRWFRRRQPSQLQRFRNELLRELRRAQGDGEAA